MDHLYLHGGEGASSVSGTIWQGSGGIIYARSAGVTKSLSDIGTGGGGVSTLDANNMPSLFPGNSNNDLGSASDALG